MSNSTGKFGGKLQSDDAVPTIVYSASASNGIGAVIKDIVDGWRMGPVWRAFAWDEIQNRYRRSVLGLAWIAISFAFFVAAISIFFGGFANLEQTRFTFYVATGIAAFQFLIGAVSDGCVVFRTSAQWIKSAPMPYSIYVYKSVARGILPFLIQMSVALVYMLVMGWRPTISVFLVFPAFAIFLVNAVAIHWLFGLVAARWRDIEHLVGSITRVLFFLTPIMWVYGERAGLVRVISNVNPFTYYVDIFRAPILGDSFIPNAWWFVIAWTLVGVIMALLAASQMRRRLPFWM